MNAEFKSKLEAKIAENNVKVATRDAEKIATKKKEDAEHLVLISHAEKLMEQIVTILGNGFRARIIPAFHICYSYNDHEPCIMVETFKPHLVHHGDFIYSIPCQSFGLIVNNLRIVTVYAMLGVYYNYCGSFDLESQDLQSIMVDIMSKLPNQ